MTSETLYATPAPLAQQRCSGSLEQLTLCRNITMDGLFLTARAAESRPAHAALTDRNRRPPVPSAPAFDHAAGHGAKRRAPAAAPTPDPAPPAGGFRRAAAPHPRTPD